MATVRAAVLPARNVALEVRDIEVPPPGPGEVLVRLAATGVCHSDLSLANGTLPQPMPAVLGHEGAGTVVSTGADVHHLAVGDPVLLNWTPPCRACWFCRQEEPHLCEHASDTWGTPYAADTDGVGLYPGLGTAAFAEETVVPAAGAVPLPPGTSLERAAVLGCAALTGVGAVRKTARVQPGESVCVIGLGGVGLSAVQGARLAGAAPILAVDASPAKEDLARQQGATDFLVAGSDLPERVRTQTGGRGVDHAFECVGKAATIRQAWNLTRRGGHATVVGAGEAGDELSFNALELFHSARTLTGCFYGSSNPAADVPELLRLADEGLLDLDSLITERIALDEIPAAFERMLGGQGGRSLVVFS